MQAVRQPLSPEAPNRGSYYDRIIPASQMTLPPAPPYRDEYALQLPDGDWVSLPFLPLPPDFSTAVVNLCVTATSFELEERLSSAMASQAAALQPDIIVGMPTLGLGLAGLVAKKLEHRFYVPLSHSRKFWFEDELSVQARSVTSPGHLKSLYIDPRLVERLEHRRVLLVDDVISTGQSMAAQLALMRKLDARVVGMVTAMQETRAWMDRLQAVDQRYPALVRSALKCPLFRRSDRGWVPDWSTMPG